MTHMGMVYLCCCLGTLLQTVHHLSSNNTVTAWIMEPYLPRVTASSWLTTWCRIVHAVDTSNLLPVDSLSQGVCPSGFILGGWLDIWVSILLPARIPPPFSDLPKTLVRFASHARILPPCLNLIRQAFTLTCIAKRRTRSAECDRKHEGCALTVWPLSNIIVIAGGKVKTIFVTLKTFLLQDELRKVRKQTLARVNNEELLGELEDLEVVRKKEVKPKKKTDGGQTGLMRIRLRPMTKVKRRAIDDTYEVSENLKIQNVNKVEYN
ncbi:hypothetical protein BDQ17DRAFT_1325178 [Cyathus striatus]|nr:hypothetical protein BDQ17DRAFT_1325178 [Cyathus striatus]